MLQHWLASSVSPQLRVLWCPKQGSDSELFTKCSQSSHLPWQIISHHQSSVAWNTQSIGHLILPLFHNWIPHDVLIHSRLSCCIAHEQQKRLATANRSRVTKTFGQGRGAIDPEKIFLTSSLITVQHSVAASQCRLRTCRRTQNLGMLGPASWDEDVAYP